MAGDGPSTGKHPRVGPVAVEITLVLVLLLLGALWAGGKALATGATHRLLVRLGPLIHPQEPAKLSRPAGLVRVLEGRETIVLGLGLAATLGFMGLQLAGPVGLMAGVVGGASLSAARERRRFRRRAELLEQQLGDLADAMAQGVRSGLSVSQALEFEAEIVESPMSELISRLMAERRLGTPFEDALRHLGDFLATEDARLFVLIVTIHARSGGNLAGALDEVTKTIRHRIAARRELRTLSAQGRMSAVILASLPIGFSLVLTAVSRDELIPIYRSTLGQAMVAVGVSMEVAAYLWMRKVLRIHV
jgi:tight adherence protein B